MAYESWLVKIDLGRLWLTLACFDRNWPVYGELGHFLLAALADPGQF
jgi:hypothetical protein